MRFCMKLSLLVVIHNDQVSEVDSHRFGFFSPNVQSIIMHNRYLPEVRRRT